MSLNWLARPSSSSPVLIEMRWAKSPPPMRSAPARSAWIGPIMRRARKTPASTANSDAAASTMAAAARRRRAMRRLPRPATRPTSVQPSGAIGAERGQHLLSLDVLGALQRFGPPRGAAGLRRPHLRQFRQIGVAQHQADVGMGDQPAAPHRRHRHDRCSPTLSAMTTSQISLRLTSATVTPASLRVAAPAPASCRARIPGGNRPGRNQTLWATASVNFGSLERSNPLPTTSMASRDTLSRSLPVESSCASSVIAGTCRNRRTASNRRCSIEPGRPWQLRRPAELALDLLDELADLGRRRFRLLVLDADQRRLVLPIIEEDLENSVRQQRYATTATNSATYLVNSRLRILAPGQAWPPEQHLLAEPPAPWCAASGWREMLIHAYLARRRRACLLPQRDKHQRFCVFHRAGATRPRPATADRSEPWAGFSGRFFKRFFGPNFRTSGRLQRLRATSNSAISLARSDSAAARWSVAIAT